MYDFLFAPVFDDKFQALLAEYEPSTKLIEKERVAAAIDKAVAYQRKQFEREQAKAEMPEEILQQVFEAYCAMVEDAVIRQAVEEQIEICGSAPVAVIKVFDEQAQPLDSSEEINLKMKAQDIREMGKLIAEYILGVR